MARALSPHTRCRCCVKRESIIDVAMAVDLDQLPSFDI